MRATADKLSAQVLDAHVRGLLSDLDGLKNMTPAECAERWQDLVRAVTKLSALIGKVAKEFKEMTA